MIIKRILLVAFVAGLSFGCSQQLAFDLPEQTDNFGQTVTYNNKVDIVWIVDTSSSMNQHQAYLSNQMPQLVTQLNAIKMDYRMVVISTDLSSSGPGGRFLGNPRVLTPTTPNLSSLLSSRILYGETSSPMERGLESLSYTLDPNYLAGEGQGFFREDAMLVVNVLSNEDDDSGQSARYWENYFESKKPRWRDGSRSWMLNYIGVLSISSSCATFGNYAEPGTLFMELADLSGGVKESICTTSLSSAVRNIRARVLEVITEFKLSQKPVLETLVVKINGQVIPQSATDGWTYNPSRNSLTFHGSAVPAPDSKISVDFKPAEAS